MKNVFCFALLVVVVACTPDKSALQIIDDAIEVHGSLLLEEKTVAFDFRNKHYSAQRTRDGYVYIRSFADDNLGQIRDVLVNSSEFERYANGSLLDTSEEWKEHYGSSVNSVLYFFQLPYGLNDDAVIKKYVGQSVVSRQLYEKVQVTFLQDNGGKDFEDVFVYWVNAKTKTVDYLAYSYATHGGGIRFRQAVNRRTVDGLVVQDYINFKPEKKSGNILNLDKQFTEGKLIELSQIISENVEVLP